MNTSKKYFTRSVYDISDLAVPLTAECDAEFYSWKDYIEDMWEHGYSIDEAVDDINFKLESIPTWEWKEISRAK